MVRILTLAAVSVLAATPLAAQEAAPAPTRTETIPTQEQVQTAAREYSIIAGALQSEDVETPIKNQLFLCLYSASMRQISDNIAQVFADNEQLDANNQEHVQQVIGAVCGVRAPEGAEAPTSPTTQPDTGEQPVGR